jgi:hypothetical protein
MDGEIIWLNGCDNITIINFDDIKDIALVDYRGVHHRLKDVIDERSCVILERQVYNHVTYEKILNTTNEPEDFSLELIIQDFDGKFIEILECNELKKVLGIDTPIKLPVVDHLD